MRPAGLKQTLSSRRLSSSARLPAHFARVSFSLSSPSPALSLVNTLDVFDASFQLGESSCRNEGPGASTSSLPRSSVSPLPEPVLYNGRALSSSPTTLNSAAPLPTSLPLGVIFDGPAHSAEPRPYIPEAHTVALSDDQLPSQTILSAKAVKDYNRLRASGMFGARPAEG